MNRRSCLRAAFLPVLAAGCGGVEALEMDESALFDRGAQSSLYPPDWELGYRNEKGLFVHDFSYAGYRSGEAALPNLRGAAIFSVLAHGADPKGERDSTDAVQRAIDAAAAAPFDGYRVVWFPDGTYRVAGTLKVTASRLVLKGNGPTRSRIRFTQTFPRHGLPGEPFGGYASITIGDGAFFDPRIDVPLAEDARTFSSEVILAREPAVVVGNTVLRIEPGDEVSVGFAITQAFLDEHRFFAGPEHGFQRWRIPLGTWTPMFLRSVVAIELLDDGRYRVQLDAPIPYDLPLRDQPSIRPLYRNAISAFTEESGVEDLGLSNAVDWARAWHDPPESRSEVDQVNGVSLIKLWGVAHGWVRNVASFDPGGREARGFHLQSSGIQILRSKNVTVTGVRLEKAQNRGPGGNGYMYAVIESNQVLITRSIGLDGRHNFIQNLGLGASGLVFHEITSRGGTVLPDMDSPGTTGCSETHRALAAAVLFDRATIDDCLQLQNRGYWSGFAGHTATAGIVWNVRGAGSVYSRQFRGPNPGAMGGAIVGTAPSVHLPESAQEAHYFYVAGDRNDPVEHRGAGDRLCVQSLYADQLRRRLNLPVFGGGCAP